MGSGPGRPVKTHGAPHGPGGDAHKEPTSHGPRPGPTHQISRGWAAARPGSSNFQEDGPRPGPSKLQRMGRSPSHFQFFTARPGLTRPIKSSKVSARPGPDKRPMTSPSKKSNFVVIRLRLIFLSTRISVGQTAISEDLSLCA